MNTLTLSYQRQARYSYGISAETDMNDGRESENDLGQVKCYLLHKGSAQCVLHE